VAHEETRQRDAAVNGGRRQTLDAGLLLIGLGAVALLVSLFLDWYGDEDSDSAVSGWTSFEIVDLLLAATALAALYAAIVRLVALRRAPSAPEALLRLAGPLALVLIVVALIDPPPILAGIDPGREQGIWIALAATAVMTLGAILSSMRISVVVSARERAVGADPAAETRPLHTDPGAGP
jgi:hypothetical protein